MPGLVRWFMYAARVFVGLIVVTGIWVATVAVRAHVVVSPVEVAPAVVRPSEWRDACETRQFSVNLSPGGIRRYRIRGELCNARAESGVLQVLLPGAGYNGTYWDFPYESETYSYVEQAVRAGHTTFRLDRLGTGASSRPFGLFLTAENQAYALAQVLDELLAEHEYPSVFTLGHSFGSLVALDHARRNPGRLSGTILTGFAHHSNPGFRQAMQTGVELAMMRAPFAGRFFDPTYVIARAGVRSELFYVRDAVDPAVLEVDRMLGDTTAIGEVMSMGPYFAEPVDSFETPVLIVIGDADFLVCGGGFDCREQGRVRALEVTFFPDATDLEVAVIPGTGHNLNLHRNAPSTFRLILDWVGRVRARSP